MRKLIVSEFVTLDGVMEAPGGEPSHPHAGWVFDFMTPEQLQYKLDEVLGCQSMLLGRVTYEGFSAAWPSRDGVFADKMNSMAKHVVSSTLHDLQWQNSTLLQGPVPTSVPALKDSDGGPILVAGSRTLVHSLLLEGLVDELRLMMFPVAIGRGIRVFPEDRTKLSWKLADQQTFPTGVLALTYHPA